MPWTNYDISLNKHLMSLFLNVVNELLFSPNSFPPLIVRKNSEYSLSVYMQREMQH